MRHPGRETGGRPGVCPSHCLPACLPSRRIGPSVCGRATRKPQAARAALGALFPQGRALSPSGAGGLSRGVEEAWERRVGREVLEEAGPPRQQE